MPPTRTTVFFEEALAILAAEGYAGLKQAALCSALGVTTGAFYHAFDSWKDFTAQLLQYWRAGRTTDLATLVRAKPDPVDQLLFLLEATLRLPHRAEAAIRVWSALDPDVAVVQRAVDAQRFDVVHAAFGQLVHDPAEARRYAEAGIALLIGFEQQPGSDAAGLEWGLTLLLHSARA